MRISRNNNDIFLSINTPTVKTLKYTSKINILLSAGSDDNKYDIIKYFVLVGIM